MSTLEEFSKQIQRVELLKENLSDLVQQAKNKFASVCNEESTRWMYSNAEKPIKSSLLSYFSFDKHIPVDNLSSTDPQEVLKRALSHPLLLFVFFFIIVFFIIYMFSFTLYCNCGRRCCSFFSCGLLLNKKKKNGKSINKRNTRVHGTEKDSSTEKDDTKTDNEKNDVMEEGEGEKADTDLKQNEEENMPRTNSNMKRMITKLTVYCFSLLLLGSLIILFINIACEILKNEQYVTESACGIIRTTENVLVGTCDMKNNKNTDETTNVTPCFAVTEVLTDGLSILYNFKEVIKVLDDQKLLTEGKNIRILEEIEESILKLISLNQNVKKNNDLLTKSYKHYMLLAQHAEEVIDKMMQDIDTKKNVIKYTAEKSKEDIIAISAKLEALLKDDVGYILTTVSGLIEKVKTFVSKADANKSPLPTIKRQYRTFLVALHILMIPLYIMVIICCLFIYELVKGNENKVKVLVVKFTGLFSAYSGIFTLILMFFALIFIIGSMVTSTTCAMTEENLNSNKAPLAKYVADIPIVSTCLENKPLVDEQYINDLLEKVIDFDAGAITKDINHFANTQRKIVKKFEENVKQVADKLWIVQVSNTTGDLYSKIKNDTVKNALLLTHIYKENSVDTAGVLRGVDDFLKIANPILLQSPYALCYEDAACENDLNKYNITEKSTTTDDIYKTIRQHANTQNNNVGAADDLDIVLQLLAYKAKIVHEKIFSVSDLDPKQKDKLNIQDYIAPQAKSGENTSFIYKWLHDFLKEMENPKHLNDFKGVILLFVEVKDHTIFQLNRYVKKLTCQGVMTDVKTVIQHFCSYPVTNIARMTILFTVMGILAFLTWFYFLCLWLHYKMITEREAQEDKINA